MLNSQTDSKWIPTVDIALVYILFCLSCALLNRYSAIKWGIYYEFVVPLQCRWEVLADKAAYNLALWLIVAKEMYCTVLYPKNPRFGLIGAN